MKIVISGGSGFIGKNLTNYLSHYGHDVHMITRSDLAGGCNRLAKVINSADVVINLAGASVIRRWNSVNKNLIISSRVDTTRLLIQSILQIEREHRPSLFISASAIGIYQPGEKHDEDSLQFDPGFLGEVCRQWESPLKVLHEVNTRSCIMRIGLVLGKDGGALSEMVPLFKLGLGGRLGSGEQHLSFIHIEDLSRGVLHLIENADCQGIYNFTSPLPTNNKNFTKVLAKSLKRPAILPVPATVLRFVLGEASSMLLDGAYVEPKRLLKDGFVFKYPDIQSAIGNIFK